MTRAPVAIALLLLAAACARSEDATLEPADANQALEKVETVRPDNADDEVALGEWRDSLQDEQRALEFGPMGAAPLFSLRCDARRGVVLQRHGLAASGDLPVMLISVGSKTRRLAVTGSAGTIRCFAPRSTAATNCWRRSAARRARSRSGSAIPRRSTCRPAR